MKHENGVLASIGKHSATVQIVLNPRAGQGRGLVLIEPLLSGLRMRGYRPSVLVTRDRTHARRWAKDCRRPPEYLICLGGDDTLDDLAEAAIRHQIPIISTPLGFGNVCPQAFGHRADVPAILNLLEAGRQINIDVGLWQGGSGQTRFFLAVTIYGFIETIKAMGEAGIDRGGHVRRMIGYLLATARWLSLGQALPSVAIEVDGAIISEGAALAVVANLPVFPGKLVFSRDADPRDGLLDICVVSGDTKRALLLALCGLLLRAPSGDHRILRRRGRVVRIRPPAAGAHPLGLDGGLETLTVLPRALPVLVSTATCTL
jgi:diacylglycerol kinase family enzyme